MGLALLDKVLLNRTLASICANTTVPYFIRKWNLARRCSTHVGTWINGDDKNTELNTLRPRRNEQHFPDDIFKRIFFNENVWISMKISLKFVPKGPINNIPALVQIMDWRRQATSHYLNQWWLVYWRIYASLGLNVNGLKECVMTRSDTWTPLIWWSWMVLIYTMQSFYNTVILFLKYPPQPSHTYYTAY